ncbi:hypothetical protein HN51_062284, partial [Arachis hypogaea]
MMQYQQQLCKQNQLLYWFICNFLHGLVLMVPRITATLKTNVCQISHPVSHLIYAEEHDDDDQGDHEPSRLLLLQCLLKR